MPLKNWEWRAPGCLRFLSAMWPSVVILSAAGAVEVVALLSFGYGGKKVRALALLTTAHVGWQGPGSPRRARHHLGTHPCSLTPRSRRGPTAGHQARSGGTRYIFASPGLAPHRRSRLSSNVRQRKVSMSVLEAVTAISLVLRRQRDWQSPHAQPRRAVRTIHTTCMLRQRGAGGTRGARQRSD